MIHFKVMRYAVKNCNHYPNEEDEVMMVLLCLIIIIPILCLIA